MAENRLKEYETNSNNVIKLKAIRITENNEWHDCVKLSCDNEKSC